MSGKHNLKNFTKAMIFLIILGLSLDVYEMNNYLSAPQWPLPSPQDDIRIVSFDFNAVNSSAAFIVQPISIVHKTLTFSAAIWKMEGPYFKYTCLSDAQLSTYAKVQYDTKIYSNLTPGQYIFGLLTTSGNMTLRTAACFFTVF